MGDLDRMSGAVDDDETRVDEEGPSELGRAVDAFCSQLSRTLRNLNRYLDTPEGDAQLEKVARWWVNPDGK